MLDFITGLVMDGLLPVFLELLKFLPIVVVLLCIVALFQHSGLILGFSCTTLAIGASQSNKRLTRFLTFIPCSAKLPVLIFILTIILGWSVFGVVFLYLLSIFVGLVLGGYHVITLPKFCRLGFKDFLLVIIRNIIEFLKRISLGLILAVSILYTMQYLNILMPIMRIFEPIFTPIGLGNGAVLACLLFGLIAKEMIIGAILSFGVATLELTTASALSFIVFVLLYTPCLPALTAIKCKHGFNYSFKTAGFSFAVAYACAFVTYMLAVLMSL